MENILCRPRLTRLKKTQRRQKLTFRNSNTCMLVRLRYTYPSLPPVVHPTSAALVLVVCTALLVVARAAVVFRSDHEQRPQADTRGLRRQAYSRGGSRTGHGVDANRPHVHALHSLQRYILLQQHQLRNDPRQPPFSPLSWSARARVLLKLREEKFFQVVFSERLRVLQKACTAWCRCPPRRRTKAVRRPLFFLFFCFFALLLCCLSLLCTTLVRPQLQYCSRTTYCCGR